MIAEIQVLPTPAGTAENAYAFVDAAIKMIAESGVAYEVGALGTTLDGHPERVWPLLRAVHEAGLEAGADRVVTVIKLAQGFEQPTMRELTKKFR